jgi:protoheme IX farnesyltransferase
MTRAFGETAASWTDWLVLTKFPIAAASTLSALVVYVLGSGGLRPGLLSLFGGVLAAAMGASALNEWQERELDGRMARTRNRPLPAGRISPAAALALALGLAGGGTALLWARFGPVPALLCAAAVLWYNGLYTPLKRWTALAVVPGSVVGALPPAIGWTAAGGSLREGPLLALAFFFFLWQVPHFWLLLFRYGGEYQEAGLPSFLRRLGGEGLRRVTFFWLAVTAASVVFLPLFGAVRTPGAVASLGLSALALGSGSAFLLFRKGGKGGFRAAFGLLNLFVLAVLGCLLAEALWPTPFWRGPLETSAVVSRGEGAPSSPLR